MKKYELLSVPVHHIIKLILKRVILLKKNNCFLSLTITIIRSYLPKVSTK